MTEQPYQFRRGESASLLAQAQALLGGQRDLIANAANLSALLFYTLRQVNWVGFYFLQHERLVLGPFQGKPACVFIPLGQGVCGIAAATGMVQRVADVHEFPGHIACDVESRSEIVVPLRRDGSVVGVLDVDSPICDRFDQQDEKLLADIAELFVDSVDWQQAAASAPGCGA